MSTRLTTDIRNAIVADALSHRFGDEVKALIDAKADFAASAYEDLYRKSDRQKMAELPAGWLAENDNFAVQFGSDFARLYFNGYLHGSVAKATPYRRTDTRRMLSKHSHGCAKTYDATHKLAVEYGNLRNKEADLKASYETASKQMHAALNAVTTVKRLVETWPEIAPFASKYEGEKPQLPSLPTDHLNAMLGLPVSEAA